MLAHPMNSGEMQNKKCKCQRGPKKPQSVDVGGAKSCRCMGLEMRYCEHAWFPQRIVTITWVSNVTSAKGSTWQLALNMCAALACGFQFKTNSKRQCPQCRHECSNHEPAAISEVEMSMRKNYQHQGVELRSLFVCMCEPRLLPLPGIQDRNSCRKCDAMLFSSLLPRSHI